jgi:acyl-CoA dehydrogenase
MDFSLSPEQEQIRDEIGKLCAKFDDNYWLEKDRSGDFPHELHAALAAAGWLGIAMPEDYGGAGLGITEAAIMMQAIAESGAAMTGASAVHMNIFGLQPVVIRHRRAEACMLPPLIAGGQGRFAVTEPDAGLDTTAPGAGGAPRRSYLCPARIDLTAQVVKVLILAPPRSGGRADRGYPVLHRLDRSRVAVRVIDKMGRHAVDSNEMFFDGMAVPTADRIGDEGEGFRAILHGMNPERILIGAEAVGIGRAALRKAAGYARERVVFGRPIGQNQGIAHPLARCWMELEAADLMVMKAASRYDRKLECGAEANAAKYLAAEAAFQACETAVLTHGAWAIRGIPVERYLRRS